MKLIPLTQDKYAQVDDEDYDWLLQWKWQARKGVHTWYATGNSHVVDGKRYTIWMHREIMRATKGIEIDHIDQNGLNNQKNNLRLCTKSENQANRIQTYGITSKYKGVVWHKRWNKWQVRITYQGKRKTLGYFDDEILAAHTYDVAAKQCFGEFASLNFEEMSNV